MKTTIKIGFSFGLLALLFNSWSWAASSGSFLTTIATQKDSVIHMYDATYTRVYDQFQKSGASLMQSLNYQSLVCLGVLSNGAFLQNLQADLKTLKLDFLNQYNTVLASATDLEEKQRIYKDSKVSLFAWGSYEKDLAVLSGQYANLVAEQVDHALVYEKSYQKKLLAFITEVNGYAKKNKELLSQISNKISLLQTLDTRFNAISSVLDSYRLKFAGTGSSLFTNIPMLKNTSVSALDASLQSVLSGEAKKYRILKALPSTLFVQKTIVISGFIQDFDSTYNQLLSTWYNNESYSAIQKQVTQVRSKYLSGNTYKCSLILTNPKFEADLSSIIKDINQFSGSLVLGTGISTTGFQSKLVQMFDGLQSKQKTLVSAYKSYAQTISQKMLADYKQQSKPVTGSDVVSSTGTQVVIDTGTVKPILPPIVHIDTGFQTPDGFKFTQAFKLYQVHKDVTILQKLLRYLGYYTGAIGNVYTRDTLSAVYHFQLDRGLLKGYEKRPQTRGWIGPATQSALNALLP